MLIVAKYEYIRSIMLTSTDRSFCTAGSFDYCHKNLTRLINIWSQYIIVLVHTRIFMYLNTLYDIFSVL